MSNATGGQDSGAIPSPNPLPGAPMPSTLTPPATTPAAAGAMPQVALGATGIMVSRLGLGGLFVSNHGGERAKGIATIKRARALGITYIDTAPGYGDSEEVLGAAFAADPDAAPVVLSTKLGGRPTPFNPKDRDGLLRSVETSLKLLGRDRLDMLLIHEPDRPGQYAWWDDVASATGPVRTVLEDLKRQGVVKAIGLAGTTAYEIARLMDTGAFDVVLTAFQFSLLWREAEATVLEVAKRRGMGVIVGSPLQQGALARRYDAEIEHGVPWMSPPRRAQFKALYNVQEECGIPLAELALRFTLSHPAVHTVLMGARSPQEVEINAAAAAKGALPAALLARLDAVAAMVPFRPYGEPFGLPMTWAHNGPGPA
jgi:aryl-alcohol dehydrogenase-like predicted oxidoreductase